MQVIFQRRIAVACLRQSDARQSYARRRYGRRWLGILAAAVLALQLSPAGAAFAVDGDPESPEPTPVAEETSVVEGGTGGVDATASAAAQVPNLGAESVEIPADAVLVSLDSSLLIVAGASTTVSYAAPARLMPVVFRAQVSGFRHSEVEVSQNGRIIGIIDPAATEISVPIEPAWIPEGGALVLTFSFTGVSGTWCAVEGSGQTASESMSITDTFLAMTGSAELPESVAEFFGNGAQSVTVRIPTGSEQELGPAALNMVAAASSAIGETSEVSLAVGDGSDAADGDAAESAASPTPPFGQTPPFAQRVVVLTPATGAVVSSISVSEEGIARLELSGGADELLAATRAFAIDGIALASAAETEGLSARIDPTAAATTLTLQQLGIGRVSLEGYGTQDAYIGVPQGAFGRVLDGVEVELNGVVSSTASSVATVQLLWNDVLVDSFVVDPDEPVFSRNLTIPGTGLRSGNGLVVRLQAVTANNECIDERLLPQMRIDIDTATSTVTGTGAAPASARFVDFPQAFAGTAQLAFGDGATGALLSAAAELVAALQRATPVPLVIEAVTAEQLVGGSAPGILIGATDEQAQQLRTPLRFSEVRLLSDGSGEVTVAVDQPYAALQAVQQSGRSLLVLGAYLGGGSVDAEAVMTAAVSGLEGTGWWQLDGSIRLATPGSEPVLIDVNEIVPQEEAKADFAPVAWWVLGGLLLLVAAGLVAAGVRARRRRSARLTVEAELAAAETEAEIAKNTAAVNTAAVNTAVTDAAADGAAADTHGGGAEPGAAGSTEDR